MALCIDCQNKKNKASTNPAVISSGGFCFPTDLFYDFETCYIYTRPKFKDWFRWYMILRPFRYEMEWAEMVEMDGEMIHGWHELCFPEIKANRGGLTFRSIND